MAMALLLRTFLGLLPHKDMKSERMSEMVAYDYVHSLKIV